MHPRNNNIGAYINAVEGILPKAASSETINGASIDRLGYDSCVLHVLTGAATGSPSAQTADFKIQDSADGTTFADVSSETSAIDQITADNTDGELDLDLSGLRRYIRVVCVVALTGGTSPTWPVAASVALGGSDTLPV